MRFGSQITLVPLANPQSSAVSAHYDLRILSIDGVTLENPLYFSESSEQFIRDPLFNRESGMRLIRKIGLSISDDHNKKLEVYQFELHENYFSQLQSMEYEIVKYPFHAGRYSPGPDSAYTPSETLLAVEF
ncbi:MAG: hypothetical protein AAF633_05860 [Chloroflexota bacterium]